MKKFKLIFILVAISFVLNSCSTYFKYKEIEPHKRYWVGSTGKLYKDVPHKPPVKYIEYGDECVVEGIKFISTGYIDTTVIGLNDYIQIQFKGEKYYVRPGILLVNEKEWDDILIYSDKKLTNIPIEYDKIIWSKCFHFIDDNSDMKIQTSSEYHIDTYNSIDGISMSIYKIYNKDNTFDLIFKNYSKTKNINKPENITEVIHYPRNLDYRFGWDLKDYNQTLIDINQSILHRQKIKFIKYIINSIN